MTNKTKLLLIIFSIFLALCLGVFVVMVFRIDAMIAEVDELAAKVSVNVKDQKNGTEQKRAMNSVASGEERLNSALIDKEKPLEFFDYIDSLKAKSGVSAKVESFDIKDIFEEVNKEKVRTHGEFVAGIRAEGSWSSIVKFLMLIETMPYKVSVDNVRISSSINERTKSLQWVLLYSVKGLTK